jgi:hypothetical protein
VSPGGFGTLFPYDWIADEDGILRQAPTPFLTLEWTRTSGAHDPGEFGAIFKYPMKPQRWPEGLRGAVFPDLPGLRQRIQYASSVRPWIDQGVSLTLPANGFRNDEMMTIAQQAWWHGIDNLRAEQRMYAPDSQNSLVEDDGDGMIKDA